MPDVLIAYFNQTWWLLKGEVHLDALLAGREAAELDVSLITCDAWPAVMRLWEEREDGKMPWAINPKVIERLKERERAKPN